MYGYYKDNNSCAIADVLLFLLQPLLDFPPFVIYVLSVKMINEGTTDATACFPQKKSDFHSAILGQNISMYDVSKVNLDEEPVANV
jgi:hypothetical protein